MQDTRRSLQRHRWGRLADPGSVSTGGCPGRAASAGVWDGGLQGLSLGEPGGRGDVGRWHLPLVGRCSLPPSQLSAGAAPGSQQEAAPHGRGPVGSTSIRGQRRADVAGRSREPEEVAKKPDARGGRDPGWHEALTKGRSLLCPRKPWGGLWKPHHCFLPVRCRADSRSWCWAQRGRHSCDRGAADPENSLTRRNLDNFVTMNSTAYLKQIP